jgi:hypothetical protein
MEKVVAKEKRGRREKETWVMGRREIKDKWRRNREEKVGERAE